MPAISRRTLVGMAAASTGTLAILTQRARGAELLCECPDNQPVDHPPNGRAWRALPPDLRGVLADNFDGAVMKARGDLIELDKTVADDLKRIGLVFDDIEADDIRKDLSKNGDDEPWIEAFGARTRALPERYSGLPA